MRARQIVTTRTAIRSTIPFRDPVIFELLDVMRRYFELRGRTDDLLNFLNRNGVWSLRSDPHGKAWSSGILKLEIAVQRADAERVRIAVVFVHYFTKPNTAGTD